MKRQRLSAVISLLAHLVTGLGSGAALGAVATWYAWGEQQRLKRMERYGIQTIAAIRLSRTDRTGASSELVSLVWRDSSGPRRLDNFEISGRLATALSSRRSVTAAHAHHLSTRRHSHTSRTHRRSAGTAGRCPARDAGAGNDNPAVLRADVVDACPTPHPAACATAARSRDGGHRDTDGPGGASGRHVTLRTWLGSHDAQAAPSR